MKPLLYLRYWLCLLPLAAALPALATTYPLLPDTSYEPATIQVKVTLQSGTLVISNLGRSPLRNLSLYAQCMDEPENFKASLLQIPAHSTARVSLALFRRAAGEGHGAERLDGGPNGQIDDLLIVCRNGAHLGRWYGTAHVKTTQIKSIRL